MEMEQDHDGSHIKGLIINFLDYFYPSLMKIPEFLVEFITPIVKVNFDCARKLVTRLTLCTIGCLGHQGPKGDFLLYHSRI